MTEDDKTEEEMPELIKEKVTQTRHGAKTAMHTDKQGRRRKKKNMCVCVSVALVSVCLCVCLRVPYLHKPPAPSMHLTTFSHRSYFRPN